MIAKPRHQIWKLSTHHLVTLFWAIEQHKALFLLLVQQLRLK
ncbi:Uncharacterised protein [Vibrio cholerae]|nr:Uncharacterised protein [Vibrio cholerae]